MTTISAELHVKSNGWLAEPEAMSFCLVSVATNNRKRNTNHTRDQKTTVLLMSPAMIRVVSRRRVQLCAIQTYCRNKPLQGSLTSLGPLFSHCAKDDNVPNHSNHHLLVTFAFVNVTVCGSVMNQTPNSSHVRHSFRLCRSWFLCC